MEWLNSIDIHLFQLINDSGFEQMDHVMILMSEKLTWIPLYLLLLYLLYKKYLNIYNYIVHYRIV